MRTVVQETQRSNEDRNQRWDRMERAELLEQYFARKAQGISQRQAAQGLEVPRSTARCRHGGRTKSASMRVPRSWPFFKASPVSPSCIDWSWRSTWYVSR